MPAVSPFPPPDTSGSGEKVYLSQPSRCGNIGPYRDLVNAVCTSERPEIGQLGKAGTLLERGRGIFGRGRLEELFYIADRSGIEQATALLHELGDSAFAEAASRAVRYRELGNAIRFCEWRQIERVLVVLAQSSAVGTVH